MAEIKYSKKDKHRITKEEVQRILEVGRLLSSVLSPEELEELHIVDKLSSSLSQLKRNHSKIGNMSVT
jgi:hypothetical protein